MQEIDDRKLPAATGVRALLAQIVTAFEVLAARQYAAPWAAARRCDGGC